MTTSIEKKERKSKTIFHALALSPSLSRLSLMRILASTWSRTLSKSLRRGNASFDKASRDVPSFASIKSFLAIFRILYFFFSAGLLTHSLTQCLSSPFFFSTTLWSLARPHRPSKTLRLSRPPRWRWMRRQRARRLPRAPRRRRRR